MAQQTYYIDLRIAAACKRIQKPLLVGARIGWIVLGFALASLSFAGVANENQAPSAVQAPSHAQHKRAGTSLEDRVKLLSKALELDANQQVQLRKVLEGQREQVQKVWSDESIPAAYRVSATQAISNRTADQIRTLLNDEQRKKFNPPKPPHEATAETDKRSVEDWMDATRPKESGHDAVQ